MIVNRPRKRSAGSTAAATCEVDREDCAGSVFQLCEKPGSVCVDRKLGRVQIRRLALWCAPRSRYAACFRIDTTTAAVS